ncbi:MAG TPA: hypothetical protein VLG91_20295 [Streptomyces sp.]|nr:hypothetical protein [Streptomyces sp.]
MTTPDTTGVLVTLPEIYAEVRAMAKTVNRVDTTLADFRAEVTTRLDDHEARIRADEANRWPWPPIVAVATVVAAVAAFAALFITRN